MIKNHIRKTIALLSFIITLIIAFPALSGTVFGPKQYVRTSGAPNTYTDTFQSTGGTGSLIIRNGSATGDDRIKGTVSDNTITSARVYLNGTVIFGPSDFKSAVCYMERSVQLNNGTNTLYVELSSSPGSYITAEVTGAVIPPPTTISLDITSPPDGTTLFRPDVSVQGTISNTSGAETGVVVNGIIASVFGDQFAANHVPLTEGQNTITANATDTNGATAAKSITVNAAVSDNFIQLSAYPDFGVAPRTVSFFISSSLSNSILNYQIDFDGNGTVDYSGATFDDINYTYTSEGIFYPQITATDSVGNSHSSNAIIIIQPKEQLEILLKAKWEQMKSALIAGNMETALSYFIAGNQEKYRQIFTALGPAKISSIFSDISSIHVADNYGKVASCGALREEPGGTYSYPLTFVKDSNGIWKIFEF